jgi:hypothetical protein
MAEAQDELDEPFDLEVGQPPPHAFPEANALKAAWLSRDLCQPRLFAFPRIGILPNLER